MFKYRVIKGQQLNSMLNASDATWTNVYMFEKCQEQNVDLYMTFVDLTKAFDTVSRDGLWKIMAKFGCPPRFIAMVRQFYDGMQARWRVL